MIANRSNYKQSGYTLVELMIGLLVGLIVLSAVIYAFLATLRSSKDLLNSTRLNMEMSVLTGTISGELRRSGYWPVSSGTPSPYGASSSDLILYPSETNANCVIYSYFNDSGPASGARVDRGFALVGGTILSGISSTGVVSCVTTGWEPLHSSSLVSVSGFSITCTDTAGSGTCGYEVDKVKNRRLDLSIDAVHATDPSWKVMWSDSIYLQNGLGE